MHLTTFCDVTTEKTHHRKKDALQPQARGIAGNSSDATVLTEAYGGLYKGLSVIVLDAHNGNLMSERTFMIDGLVRRRAWETFRRERPQAGAIRRSID